MDAETMSAVGDLLENLAINLSNFREPAAEAAVLESLAFDLATDLQKGVSCSDLVHLELKTKASRVRDLIESVREWADMAESALCDLEAEAGL